MTFEAKTLVPLPCDPDAVNATFEDAASGGITLVEAPARIRAYRRAGTGIQRLWTGIRSGCAWDRKIAIRRPSCSRW